jgi:hypothetical protein
LKFNSIEIQLNTNWMEEKWDAHWCKSYWKSAHDYGIEKNTLKEHKSQKGFWPLGNNNRSIFERIFLKDDIFGLCWNLRLVIELWYVEGFWFLLEDFFFFGRLYFCMVKYLNFHNSSFALRYFVM